MYDVFGIGSPLLDAIVKIDDSHLAKLNLKKGQMHLVDADKSKKTFDMFKNDKVVFVPGGDVVNTMNGIANLGGKAIFLGKIGVDNHGFIIEETMKKDNVKTILIKGTDSTGSCISFVTPDNERTFVTHLGAAVSLTEKEIVLKDIKNSKILYVTGYFLENPILRNICILAMNEAKKHNKQIAIDVSDSGVVNRAKNEILNIIENYADITFANEEEILALTGKTKEEGLFELSKITNIAIVKIGKEGALICENKIIHKIKGFNVNAVDTTGAGDMFAAGFLFGLTNNYDVKTAGLIGNFVASKVVQQLGGRVNISLKDEIKQLFK